MEHDVEQEFLEFNEFCPDAAVSFPPSIGIKITNSARLEL